MFKKKAQVWIETVIYTLIAFVIIGMVLAFAKPKIEEMQDKAIIEQSIGIMENINSIIVSVIQGGEGNKRLLELGLKKGVLKINSTNDRIIFEIESRYTYSEPGEDIVQGNIIVRTEKRGEFNKITLTTNYPQYNITYDGKDELKTISSASTQYKISILNKGREKFEPETDQCDVKTDCENNMEGYNPSCEGSPISYCAYTAKRPTINIEIA